MNKTLTTPAKVCTVLAIIAGAVTLLPLLALAGLAVFAFVLSIVCLAMVLFGVILWICTGESGLMDAGTDLFEFATKFNRIIPLANFWLDHVVPISAWVSIALAVVALVLWLAVLFRPVAPILAPVTPAPIEDTDLEDYLHVEPIPDDPEPESKPAKPKKSKSDRSRPLFFLGVCIAIILLSIVALLLAGNVRF